MIVKDESHIIHKTLSNLIDKVTFDYWIICDTGSSDNTCEIIEQFFKENNIPGELHHHEWKDFSHNRNLALKATFEKTDYTLIFDADDEIHGDFNIPDLSLDHYQVIFSGGYSYIRTILINNRKRWKYMGVLHETLISDEDVGPSQLIKGDYYFISGRLGHRNKNPNKYQEDAEILATAYNESETELWLKIRYAFYCAQSYKDALLFNKAIEWYNIRIAHGGWAQEQYYACLMIGDMYMSLNDNNAVNFWIKTLEYDKIRYEGISNAAQYFIKKKMPMIAELLYDKVDFNFEFNKEEKLFLNEDLHNYSIFSDMVELYSGIYKFDKALDCLMQLIKQKHLMNYCYYGCTLHNAWYISCNKYLTQQEYENILDFSDFCRRKGNITEDHTKAIVHFVHQIKPLFEAHHYTNLELKKTLPVVITLTSCKRLSLFIKTVNSLRRAFTDLECAMDIICIDDGSSPDDCDTMKHLFPWIRFILKSETNKGHRSSMNIIYDELERLQAKYWIQLEDDWTFIRTDNYLLKSITYLEKYKSQGVRQILFNKGYCEIPEDSMWPCGEYLETELLLHVMHHPSHPCGYWPHFSFRPSLIDVDTILQLGNFESPNTFFEQDYADKYCLANYKSAYLDRLSCIHSGSLAGLRAKSKNAYQLNNENQYSPDLLTVALPLQYINLEKRADRKENMEITSPLPIICSTAIDGDAIGGLTDLELSCLLYLIEEPNYVKGELGCKFSHLRQWITANKVIGILEDDVIFASNCKEQIEKLRISASVDLVYIGGMWIKDYGPHVDTECDIHTLTDARISQYFDSTSKDGLFHRKSPLDKDDCEIHPFITPIHRCTGGYVVTPKGCSTLLNCIINNPELFITEPLDNWLVINCRNGNVDACDYFPHSISQLWDPITGNIRREKRDHFSYSNLCRTIKIIGPKDWWESLDRIRDDFAVMCQNNYRWGNLLLTTDHTADIYVIINSPDPKEYYEPDKTIIFQMEPFNTEQDKMLWGEWWAPSKHLFLHVNDSNYLNVAQTQFRIPSQIPDKETGIASILSASTHRRGHRLRVNFIKAIELTSLKTSFKIYGRENYHNVDSYRGPIKCKSEVLMKYKYYFMGESELYDNYATEKIWEPILCECLCFYWGCPNLESYIDSRAFVRLDLDDIPGSIIIIEKALKENWWALRLPYIREAKKLIEEKYSFFPLINELTNNYYDRRIQNIMAGNQYIFYQGYDLVGNDIIHHSNKSPSELRSLSLATPHCHAYNTLGYLKLGVHASLDRIVDFSPTDGIYIKQPLSLNSSFLEKPHIIMVTIKEPLEPLVSEVVINEDIAALITRQIIVSVDGMVDNGYLYGAPSECTSLFAYALSLIEDENALIYFVKDIISDNLLELLKKVHYGYIYSFDSALNKGNHIEVGCIDISQIICDIQLLRNTQITTNNPSQIAYEICVQNHRKHLYL